MTTPNPSAKPSALVDIPNKAQVGDMGIDGRIYPVSAVPSVRSAAFRPSPPVGSAAFRPSPPPPVHGGTEGGPSPASPTPALPAGGEGEADGLKPALQTQAELGFLDLWYPIQVKQKDKVGRPDIDSFEAVMTRENRTKGFFVAFDYSQDALTEIDAFFRHTGKAVIPLTVNEILEEQIARKLV